LKNVLVADNQAIVCLGLTTLIESLPDFQVINQVDNGVDAYMQIEQGNVDILITELTMPPGESGLLTTRRVHDAFPDVAIMILSSCEDQALINQAIHNGAQSYIFKSSPTTEIVTGLHHLVDGERYLDNNIMITKQDLEEINYGSTAVDMTGYQDLSKRERELLPFIALGYSNKEVAKKLFISTKTVEAHKASIMRKLALDSQAALIRYAVHHHLISF
jgi:two-component system response regulator NreC